MPGPARRPDKDGKFVCTFPPDAIIQRLPADVQGVFSDQSGANTPIVHDNDSYSAGRTLLHFPAQPEPFLSLKPPNVSHQKCSA